MSDELRARALRLLARRDHTRFELQRKLISHGDADEIGAVLDQLEQNGLLSDARFVESYLAAKRRRFGAARLRHELRMKGVPELLIDDALAVPAQNELELAWDVWRRKFGTPPVDPRDYARQLRFLQSRGFAADTLKSLLKFEQEQ